METLSLKYFWNQLSLLLQVSETYFQGKQSYSPNNSKIFLCLSRAHGICWPLRLKKTQASEDSINVNIIEGILSLYTLVSKAIIGRVILPNHSIGMKVVSSWSPFQIARQAASIISLQVIDYFCQLING